VLVVIRVKKLTMSLNWLLYRVCVKIPSLVKPVHVAGQEVVTIRRSVRCSLVRWRHILSLGKNLPLLITPWS